MSVSEQVHQKRRLLSAGLRAVGRRLWSHPAITKLYPDVLFRMHCMTRASIPLMEAAVERFKPLVEVDPVASGVIEYLNRLIPEELSHDDWILEDLEALGFRREEVLARVPPATVAAVVGAQYYWIYHHHPVTLLGFIAVVEGDPPTVGEAEELIRKTGLPRSAFRNYLRHAVLEPTHNAYMDRMLDSLPFTPEHLSLLGMSMARTIHLLAQSAEEIIDLHEIQCRLESKTTAVPSGNAFQVNVEEAAV